MALNNTYDSIYDNESFNTLIDSLTHNEFIKRKLPEVKEIKIERENIRKYIWMASILADSKDENHIRKIQLFAALLFLNYRTDIDVTKSAYVLFSRSGNLVSTKFFTELFRQDYSNTSQILKIDFDLFLDIELNNTREDNTIHIENETYLTTRFQKSLWNTLVVKSNISISAPTSAGKSFIIKKYIKKQLQEQRDIKVLYIVPSRALINQVSEEFRVDLNNQVDIKTAFIEENELDNFYNKQLFIFTPERCLKLLQHSWTSSFKLDVIFVDEIQNAEDEGGRGTLFEYILRELALLNVSAQIITAGPNIINAEDLHNRLFGLSNINIQTTLSPVFQIKTIVKIDGNSILINVNTQDNKEYKFKIDTEINLTKKFKSSIGDGLPEIIKRLTSNGQNIIYSPKTTWAEDWALKYSDTLDQANVDLELEELIDFIKEEIHPKYYLIDCLLKGVAFHHSKLPDIIRKEIENMFLSGKITNLFCTSTLLEGVNLPANNLFVIIPTKKIDKLTPFEFGNLIGRAGRIKDSLYGTIFCIERDNDDLWADNYYEKTYGKEVVTVLEKTLLNFPDFQKKLILPISEINNSRDANTVTFLRQKLISGENEFRAYLALKKTNKENINTMFELLSATLSNINLDASIIRLNPTIDPIIQNQLYNEILNTGIINWVIVPNSNFYRRIKRENKDLFENHETSFFWQLVSIIEKLDEFFSLGREAAIKHNISLSVAQMCISGINWMESKSYKELIQNDLNFYSNHTNPNKKIDLNSRKDVNIRINQVIKINTTIVSYILVKYLKVLNDILIPIMSPEEKEKYKFSLSLPTMLELGTTEPTVIQLISSGIPRSVALKVFSVYKNVDEYEKKNVFTWLSEQSTLGLKSIYERYLISLRILAFRQVER